MKELLVSMDSYYSTTRLLSRREPEIVNEPEDGVEEDFTPSRKTNVGEGFQPSRRNVGASFSSPEK